MGLISFLFFQCKTAFNVNTCHVIPNTSQLLPSVQCSPPGNCSNLTIVFHPLGNFGQALCIRSCHEDLILTRKSHNCAGIAFIQGDSAGGSKLIEQTDFTHLKFDCPKPANFREKMKSISISIKSMYLSQFLSNLSKVGLKI